METQMDLSTTYSPQAPQALPAPCLFPPCPFHIQEKKRAKLMLQRLVSARRFGISTGLTYWQTVNYAESLLRSAIREHRFAVMKNAPVQTFGNAFARRIAEQVL
jgi:hypothetical protein